MGYALAQTISWTMEVDFYILAIEVIDPSRILAYPG